MYAFTGLLRQHPLDSKLRDVNIAFEVGFREPTKILRRIIGEQFREEDTGIIDDIIYRTEAAYRGLRDFRGG
jgi:hypothetical protein